MTTVAENPFASLESRAAQLASALVASARRFGRAVDDADGNEEWFNALVEAVRDCMRRNEIRERPGRLAEAVMNLALDELKEVA